MKTTRIIVAGLVALIAVVDIALLFMGLPTISRFILESSKSFPIVPFVLGILAGHLFWPMHDKEPSP